MKNKKTKQQGQRKETYKNRLSLTIIFAIVVFAVLFISIAIFVAATFIFSQLGFLSKENINSPDIKTLLISGALISIAIGFTVAMLTLKYPLKSFNKIITQMNRLAKGDFKARLYFGKPIASYPAFKETSESFNKMAEELEGSEMLRSDFINNISHEFKTPIVSIAGFAKLLRRGNLTEEQKEEYLKIIEEESLRLSHVATNVLNLTKIENQNILTDVTKFNISEQIRSAALLLEDKWSKKDIDLNLDLGEFSITANEELLKQVWINLIDNAVKFSPKKGKVDISITENNHTLTFVVSNKGEVSKESIKKIFNKFYQADESHAGEGNGVGLAIVKKITELHRGKIEASSDNGVVSFTLTLPKKQ